METLTPTADRQNQAGRPRRTWPIILIVVVVVVAGVALATWAIVNANESDEFALATEFADTWVEAWLTSDGEAAAALFTEDAVFEMPGSEAVMEGRDNIGAFVSGWGQWMTEMQRGDVTQVADGVFIFPVERVFSGQSYASDMRITFEGDLVSHAIDENARQAD